MLQRAMPAHVGLALAWALTLAGAFAQAASSTLLTPEADHPDVGFALLRYAGGNYNPRPRGLPQLAWEIRRRTSIAMDLGVAEVDPASDGLFAQPLLVWQGDAPFTALPQRAVDQLRSHLLAGGSLLVDVSDGAAHSPVEAAVRRELERILPNNSVVQVPHDHVVYKSFYLADRHGGRTANRASLDGIFIDGRLAVLICANDLAGALARDAFGAWQYDVGPGGETTREMTVRLGLNWVMYVLCLDYKEDQVHLPFILQRRR